MEIIRDDAKKLVQVWLSQRESRDAALQSRLKPMYAQWKQQKYMKKGEFFFETDRRC